MDDDKEKMSGVADRIWALILSSGLEVGDRLPPERHLAEMFAVSRGAIRLGIQSLAERGILTKRQGDGTYVSSVSEDDFLKESMAMAIRVNSELLRDVLEFRRILEPPTASLAAGRISERELDSLKIAVCEQQLQEKPRSSDLDAVFHLKLAQYSGNSVLYKVMTLINDILAESRLERYQSDRRKEVSVAGHLKIIKALEQRNPDLAFQAMRDHLDEVETEMTGMKNGKEVKR